MTTPASRTATARAAEIPTRNSPRRLADPVDAVERRLRRSGLRVSLQRRGRRVFTGGLSVVLDGSDDAWQSSVADLFAAASARLPVGLGISASAAYADLAEWLPGICDVLSSTGIPCSISVEAGAEVSRIEELFASLPSATRRFLFADGPGCRTGRDVRRCGSWLPAMHAGVRSRCPLLAAEASGTLLPRIGLAVPARSAWVPIVLDVMRFATPSGEIDEVRLLSALDVAVDGGEQLHDLLCWSGEKQTEDARINRRLAILITGLGDLVAARGADPASLDCLRDLDRFVGRMHTRAWQRSAALAELKGPLPALSEKQPSALWCDESHRQDWARRWRQAVAKVQVRHRNLVALSPYSFLRRNGHGSVASADLMPLLAHADAIAFAPLDDRRPGVDIPGFEARMRAQVERLNATTLIAASA